jgi:hypothetical protein
MSLDIVAVSKLDGGYLITTGDDSAVRVTWDEVSFLIKKWLDEPKPKKNKSFPFPFYSNNDIYGLGASEQTIKEVIQPPDWVDEELKED